MNVRVISIAAVLIMFSGLSIAAICNVSDGAVPITVTDGTGQTFEYTEPTERIVTMGYASTLTVAMLGEMDKIIAVDAYSTYEYSKDERLKGLKAEDMGSIFYASNNDKIVTKFLQWVDDGKMSFDDTIVLTTYENALVLRGLLNGAGFEKVLVYRYITEYNEIVDFVNSMSVIVTGGTTDLVKNMRLVKETIDNGLSEDIPQASAFGVWYSSSAGYSVLNSGSITVSLIEAAGGINVGFNESSKADRYGDKSTIVQLVGAYPDAIVFLPESYTRDHTVGEFRNEVLNGNMNVTIVPMKANWNNYCPDAAEGLWVFACALYPDLFEGDVPHGDEGSPGSNLLLYAAAGIVALLAIFGAAYFLLGAVKHSMGGILRRERKNPNRGRKGRRLLLTVALLAAIMIFSVLLDLSWAGDHPLSLKEVWDVLIGAGTSTNDIIVKGFNSPRVVFGIFVGAALSVTGGVMQAVFRNPLASPYLLGLSAGASLGASIAILFSVSMIPLALTQPILAFVFCLGTMLLVYMLSRAGGYVRTETLILAGVAVTALISAIVSFLTYIAPSEKMGAIVFWSMGSLSKVTWDEMAFSIPVIIAGIILMLSQSKNLNAMMLGDSHAMDLGVDVRRVRLFLLIISSLVVAAAVAFVGAIGFIGLVIPHIFRLLLGPDNRLILPLSAFGGAAFILLCDYIAHVVAPYYGVMPIGIVTAFIGAPFFIYLLSRKRSEVGW
ncbi:MAG: iron chelate uptake ABC transporter family permease subunit [Methanomassiliicoccaceae archaeon]|nr:iron chelate uptake ABC transporter family permease subunit [Methanomassiliicoccaceae archaeon]